MPRIITGLSVRDIRTPTSRSRAGSDAMHTDPDYSAAYVVLTTDSRDGLEGHGLTFTIGRGTEVCVAAVNALKPLIVGRSLESIAADMGGFWRSLTGESQLRWIGPEKGAIHLATAAIVNAVWDLYAKAQGKPVWKLVADLTPEQFVACVDFRYLTDALTPEQALDILRCNAATRAAREAEMRRVGLSGVHTSAGWIGYPDDKVRSLCRDGARRRLDQLQGQGGADLDDDRRRCSIVRAEIGPELRAYDRREPALGRPPGDRMGMRPLARYPALDRGADQPRRHPRPRGDRQGPGPVRHRRRHGRALPQPRDVQAAAPGQGDLVLPGRRVPAGRA